MDQLKNIIDTVNGIVWGWPDVMPFMVAILLATGLVTTFRLAWIQVRYFMHGIRVIRGEYDDPEHKGDISHFQALTTALSATVGIGNIAGVATAIHYGGPGALFWMWITAVFGMALKYTECTLSMRYRVITSDGTASGGPMYSIVHGLGSSWKPLAVAFAIFAVISSFGSGNSVQSFTVADQLRQDLSVPTWITGLVMASLVGAVIIGGIKRIGRVTSKLVPFMASIYVAAALIILMLNVSSVLPTIKLIITSAFQPAAQIGGFAGGSFIFMLTWGIKRGLFSNESGQGSAPIAHAAAKTDEPVREGVVAMLGPFIDTLIICTMTGLVILTTGVWKDKQNQSVLIDQQASLTALYAGAVIQQNGKILAADLAAGRFTIKEGQPEGFILVRNHGIVENLKLFYTNDPVLQRDAGLFNGFVEIPATSPGSIESAKIINIKDKAVDGYLIMEGNALQNGSPLTSWAFRKGLGDLAGGYGHLIVTFAVFLFGISTAISWSYYGDRSIHYLLGNKSILPYKIGFCIMHFIGAVYSLELVWGFGDTALGLMTLPNLLAIILLTGMVKKMTKQYISEGKLEPPKK